jgi:hypothetical protein
MKATTYDNTNVRWKARVDESWQAVMSEVLKRGFHGRANVEVHIADGTIHRVTRVVERVEK